MLCVISLSQLPATHDLSNNNSQSPLRLTKCSLSNRAPSWIIRNIYVSHGQPSAGDKGKVGKTFKWLYCTSHVIQFDEWFNHIFLIFEFMLARWLFMYVPCACRASFTTAPSPVCLYVPQYMMYILLFVKFIAFYYYWKYNKIKIIINNGNICIFHTTASETHATAENEEKENERK